MGLEEWTDGSSSVELCPKEKYCNRLPSHSGKCKFFSKGMVDDLPEEVYNKLDKTAMTRGAQPKDRVPYQNRVRRWNRAVIPLEFKNTSPDGGYDNGYTIMVRPSQYFDEETGEEREDFPGDVNIGDNAFIFYSTRQEWDMFPPKDDWEPCKYVDSEGNEKRSMRGEVYHEGEYIARAPATVAEEKVVRGEAQGIRFFEYASERDTREAQFQLAYLAWKTEDMEDKAGTSLPNHLKTILEQRELIDREKFEEQNMIKDDTTICPLCREPIKAEELMSQVEQTQGRENLHNRITEANLFHLDALEPGRFTHKPYKLGWGHHHCNQVAHDDGVDRTLDWMEKVLRNNNRI
ncbi:BstXI family restriction endonuclease [Haloarcula salina]|uniref:BstXI family restriction endonuclease n=1 Tax=Haloarcula salina TaxID=1429914 RepID=A0AA41KI75_9EURY|nr:BstXI family restriction endonuclease [Haloarcula salina]MBV0901403.1 BstXI family restriction endonuclease [Haloarcula salina]